MIEHILAYKEFNSTESGVTADLALCVQEYAQSYRIFAIIPKASFLSNY
jgi:hypothetical protein